MNKRITIRVTDTTLALLKEQSQKENKPVSDLIREAIEIRFKS